MKDTAKSGWVEKPLGEISTLQRGFDLPKRLREPGEFPLVTSSGPTDTHSEAKVKGPGVATGRSGSIGNVFFVEDDFWPLNTALYVKDFHGNDPRFVYYLLNYVDLARFASGAGVPTLNRNDVHGELYRIPANIEEQQRIVAVLDEAFEGLARARAHAEANLEDSHEIAARALDVLIADLIERNGRIPISEIAAVKGGKRLPKGEETSTVKTPFPYITVRDFTEDGTVSTEKLGFISEEVQKGIARYTISSQDVYVSIAGTIGKSGIVPDELDGANLTENAAKLVLEDGWSNEYIYWCTRSSDFGVQTAEQTRVAAQPKLALQRLGAITVPKADEAEQVELCEKMAYLRSTRSNLVVAYGQKLQDLDNLRQSLLQKAFAGELT